MFEYTYQQHFQFGYARPGRAHTSENVDWMCNRKRPEDLFVAKYGRAKTQYSSWREANKAAALHILKSCRDQNLKPLICYSGGLDSEIVLVAFLEARKELDPEFPIDVATLLLDGDVNRHDTDFVERFKDRMKTIGHSPVGLQFHSKKLNATSFWNSPEFLKLAKETQIVSPIVICQAWLCGEMLLENPCYLPIIGQGEIHLVKDTTEDYQPGVSPYLPSVWRIAETENLCGLYRYFIARMAPAIPGFFQFLPEQFETQLRTNPIIHELVSNARVGKLGTRSSKREIVLHDYPELETRPKFHGFEPIEAEHDVWRRRLNELMPECEGHWYMDFFSLYRRLQPEKRGVLEHDDWSTTIGRDGNCRLLRLDEDDIFTTQWTPSPNPIIAGWNSDTSLLMAENISPLHEVEAALRKFLSKSNSNYLLYDGSLAARWLYALQPDMKVVGASFVPRLPASMIVPEILATSLYDSDSLLLFLLAKSAKDHTQKPTEVPSTEVRLVVPKINARIESEHQHVWIENEREARLVVALRSLYSADELAVPFCDSQISFSVAKWLRAIGPANWSQVLTRRVLELEANTLAPEFNSFRRQAESVRRRVDNYLENLARPKFAAMNSSITLSGSTLQIGDGLNGFDNALQDSGLVAIPTEDWLARVKFATPDLKLGSNLFYRQAVHGRQLIAKEFRAAVALKAAAGETICTACVQILDPEPNGTLRIRGVVTEPQFRRQGYATDLLMRLTDALRKSPAICSRFASIEVWAAPEIVNAFTAAGFLPDYHRSPLNEPLYITEENKLVTSIRVLKPMTRSLR